MAKRSTTSSKKKQEETLVDIVEAKEQAQDFFETNQNLLLGGLFLLVLVIGGLFAYTNFYKAPRQQEAMEQMYQAQMQFEKDSFALALSNPGAGFEGFLGIIEKYSGTAASNLAHYYAGVSYLRLGEYDAAISYLNDFSASDEVTPIMKKGAIGDAYSEQGEMDKAISQYKSAVGTGDNELLTAYYLKKLGMLYQKQGQVKEAMAAFKRLKTEYPNAPDSRDIEKYISRLEGQSTS